MSADTLILDANVLVLLAVGLTSESYIARHKRLHAYTVADYRLLAAQVARFSHIVVTPNMVTEASNLARQIARPAAAEISLTLAAMLDTVVETYVASRDAVDDAAYPRLGVTDAALLSVGDDETVLLTADLGLYLEAARRGQMAVNFNHMIEAGR